MARPAGVQIRFWFGFLVGLLLLVGVTALGGSILVSRSFRAVSERAAPVAEATGAIRFQIMAAQNELFRYLSELSDDTTAALGHLDALNREAETVLALDLESEAQENIEAEIQTIQHTANRYRKVLELLPSTVAGARDWTRLQEYSQTAVQLGREVESRATRLAEDAQKEIRQKNQDATRIAIAATWVSTGVLLVTLLAVLALRHWWKRFQEIILGF